MAKELLQFDNEFPKLRTFFILPMGKLHPHRQNTITTETQM